MVAQNKVQDLIVEEYDESAPQLSGCRVRRFPGRFKRCGKRKKKQVKQKKKKKKKKAKKDKRKTKDISRSSRIVSHDFSTGRLPLGNATLLLHMNVTTSKSSFAAFRASLLRQTVYAPFVLILATKDTR